MRGLWRDLESPAAGSGPPAVRQVVVVRPPTGMNAYEFVVMSALRAQQLMQGCVALVEGDHKPTVLAQMEISMGRIGRATETDPSPAALADASPRDTQA